MKRGRSSLDEYRLESQALLLGNLEIKLEPVYTDNSGNQNPPDIVSYLAVDTQNFVRLSPGTGIPGPQGIPGPPGDPGPQGIPGTNGTNGTDGTNGVQGMQGDPGIPGTNGTNGVDGTNGTNGVQGMQGIPGTPGTNGTNGIDGTDGTDGTNGIDGTNGTNGTNGAQGIQGIPGTNGTNGAQGIQGIQGVPGNPTTLAAVGSSPNANAMTLSGSTLNLQPANSSFPGVVSTVAQDFLGVKNFVNGVRFNSGASTLNLYQTASGTLAPTLDAGTVTTMTVRAVASAVVGWSVERIGNTVTLRLNQFTITADTSSPSNITFTNLVPAGYRPSFNIQNTLFFFNNGTSQFNSNYIYTVNTGGSVTFGEAEMLMNFVPPYGIPGDFVLSWLI